MCYMEKNSYMMLNVPFSQFKVYFLINNYVGSASDDMH